MIKALALVENRLASGIALRYACKLASIIEMDIKTIHVEEADSEGNPPGTGWVKQTWEKGLLETAEVEISQIIQAERAKCPTLSTPKMKVGDRDDEILRELEEESFDLFVDGILYAFNASHFEKKICSRLYKETRCPMLLVKNIVSIRRIALLIEDHTNQSPLIQTFFKTLGGGRLEFDLIHVKLLKPGRVSYGKNEGDAQEPGKKGADKIISNACDLLTEAGLSPKETKMIRDVPAKVIDYLQDYGMVISSLPRPTDRKSLMLELLSRVPSATLIC